MKLFLNKIILRKIWLKKFSFIHLLIFHYYNSDINFYINLKRKEISVKKIIIILEKLDQVQESWIAHNIVEILIIQQLFITGKYSSLERDELRFIFDLYVEALWKTFEPNFKFASKLLRDSRNHETTVRFIRRICTSVNNGSNDSQRT